MTVLESAAFIFGAVAVEFLLYRYISSEDRFKVTRTEKAHTRNHVQRIASMKPTEMIAIVREIRDGLAQECQYLPIRQILQYTWGLSEEISDKIASTYGTRFSEDKKQALDENLSIFQDNYAKGMKFETYDSIATIFHEFLGKDDEKIDRVQLSRELKEASRNLAEGRPSFFLDVLSKYVQRPLREADIMLVLNAINDIVYRARSRLSQGPTYYEFLKDISVDLEAASEAVETGDSLLLYETYENIFEKARRGVESVERFQSEN